MAQDGPTRVVEREVINYGEGNISKRQDLITSEEPLEIRLHGKSVAVVMRTPLDDFDLVAGFLLTEGLIAGPEQLGTISYCKDAEPPNLENVVDVTLVRGVEIDYEHLTRNFYASSSCGICGKASIDQIEMQAPPFADSDFHVTPEVLFGLSNKLREQQQVFDQTGSLHAAGLFATDGELLALREDVGRHNAVDKLVGSFVLRDRLPPPRAVLLVSGRTSFEIVQKARMSGIAVVAAVSAPSSLAVDLAREAGMTLLGFLRGQNFNTYSGSHRISESQ